MTGELDGVKNGQWLCIIGRGTANLVHRHVIVTGVTKLYVNSEYQVRDQTLKNRHRKDSGRSTPDSPYGGTHAYTSCQRPKKDS